MGCATSSTAKVLPPPDDAPLSNANIAKKLSEMLSIPESALREALPGLNRCFARRLPGKRIYKPLDLWTLTAFVEHGGSGPDVLPADVIAELSTLSVAARSAMTDLLQSGHKCGQWFPKICIGNASIHKNMPSEEHRPVAHAFDEGNRLLVLPDPTTSIPPMDWNPNAVHDGEAIGRELAGKDMSRNVLLGMPGPPEVIGKTPWTDAEKRAPGAKIKASIETFRERIGYNAGTFDGKGKALGQPCHDCYCLFAPASIGPKMSPLCDIPIDVWWRELEELVYSGEVRSIGLSNFTKLQVQGILGCCRIRPAVLWTEVHPWADSSAMSDLVDFCLSEGIAVMAHTPLAQATRLDDERLANVEGLTPAQVALRWAIDKGMTVNVGVKEKWQIKENLNTPLDVPLYQTLAPPETPLYLQIANVPGWRGIVAAEGGGCLKVSEDGHLYCHTLSEEGVAKAEKQHTLSKKHAVVFASLLPIVRSLPSNADVKARRSHIAAALAKLAEEAEKKGDGEVAVLAQMQVVPLAAFVEHGAIPRRSAKAGTTPHVPVTSLPEHARVLFFSQRWLRRDHPDDEAHTKHAGVVAAAKSYAEREGIDTGDVYIWFDFASVEQDDFKEMIACINALGLYIAASDAFIAFEHPEYWGRAWCLVEQTFGDAVRVPRFNISLTNELGMLCDGKTLKNKMVDPVTGQLTVESDRPVIEMEAAIAIALRSQLYYGLNAQIWTSVVLEEEIKKSLAEGSDGHDGDITGMHGREEAKSE